MGAHTHDCRYRNGPGGTSSSGQLFRRSDVSRTGALSLVYTWMLAPFIKGGTLWRAGMLGLLFGLVIYAVNFYLFTAIFPWFVGARNWITIFAHWVFGGVLASSYFLMRHRPAGRERSL